MELILVMVIMCMVMALAAPSLQGWSRGSKLRNSADEFVAATKFARTKAVSSGYPCVVSIDRQGGTFSVKQQNGQNLSPVEGEFGETIPLLEGGKIEAINLSRQPVDAIMFYPTGRVQPASVTITADNGEAISITCSAPAEDFGILENSR